MSGWLWSFTTIGRGKINVWCRGSFYSIGSQVGHHFVDETWVRNSEGACVTIMINGEAKKGCRRRVSFDVIVFGETGHEIIETINVMIFDTVVVYHQRKINFALGVTKQTGSTGFNETSTT